MATGYTKRGEFEQVIVKYAYTVSANASKSISWDDGDIDLSDYLDRYIVVSGYASGNNNCIVNRITTHSPGASTDFNYIMTIKNMSSSQRTGTARLYLTIFPKAVTTIRTSFLDSDADRCIFKTSDLTDKYSLNSETNKTLSKDDFHYGMPNETIIVGFYNMWGGNQNITVRNLKADDESVAGDALLTVKNTGSSDLSNITAEFGMMCVRGIYFRKLV